MNAKSVVLNTNRHRQHGSEAYISAFHNLTPLITGLQDKHPVQDFNLLRPARAAGARLAPSTVTISREESSFSRGKSSFSRGKSSFSIEESSCHIYINAPSLTRAVLVRRCQPWHVRSPGQLKQQLVELRLPASKQRPKTVQNRPKPVQNRPKSVQNRPRIMTFVLKRVI